MLLRDIIIILTLLLILLVLKIINNRFIEDFTVKTRFEFTDEKAITQNNNVNANDAELAILQDTTGDVEQRVIAEKKLSDSTQYNDDNVLQGGLSLKEIDDLFSDTHGEYIKHKNKKCDYLDINPPIPCEDTGTIPEKGPSKCQINCAKNCLDDERCISFEYDRKNKSCQLSSSCYSTEQAGSNLDINYFKDVYFKRSCKDSCDDKNNEGDNTNNKKCCIPALAQFNKRENKKCSNYTKIQQNGTFNNQTLSGCAQKCLDNPKCISFEFKKKDGINSNVCNLTDDCHELNYNNDNNTDVFMKNNVIVNKIMTTRQLPCPNDNKRKIPFRKRIIFYKYKNFREDKKKWRYDFNSNEKIQERKMVKKHKRGGDDYDSIRIPPQVDLHLFRDYYFTGRHKHFRSGDGSINASNLDRDHVGRNHVSSWHLTNRNKNRK